MIQKADNQDTGRKVVPLRTRSGVQIGLSYQPKQRPVDAQWISRHVAQKPAGVGRWIAFCGLAILALYILAGRS